MLKLKIWQKLVLLVLILALIPLIGVSYYWYHLAEISLKNDASHEQTVMTDGAVKSVSDFMTNKVNLLIVHSQTDALQSFDPTMAASDLQTLIKQDNNIQSVALVDSSGNEKAVVNSDGTEPQLQNISNSADFKAATFLAGDEYFSPVHYNNQKQPSILIAVPLVNFSTSHNLNNLSTGEPGVIRNNQSIKGVLIANVNLSSLWQNVLSEKLGNNGYAYVVDSQGSLIAYPDSNFLSSHHNLSSTPAVAAFLNNPQAASKPTRTMSEKGVAVLSSYQQVPQTGWGVIAEQPVSSIYASANKIAQIGAVLVVSVAFLIVVLGYVFSRRLTKPIEGLALGADQLSHGDLGTRVKITERDEIGTLQNSFNIMAGNLSTMVQRANAELAKSSVILDNVGEGVVAIDSASNIILANIAAGELAGLLPRDIIGQKIQDVFSWTQNDRPFQPPLDTTKLYEDILLTNASKRIYYLDIFVNQISNDPSGIKAIFTILDKTGERDLEKMKLDFVSMAAHELRTPITSIRGYLEIILDDKSLAMSEENLHFLQNIRSSASQLAGLINNLLNVSRIERGTMSLRFDKIDWNEALQKAIEDQRFSADSKNITLEFTKPDEPVYILADRLAMMEIVNNLLTNAIHYTNNGGRVVVHLKETDDKVITEVEDNGIGISTNDQQHLFTKFYRAHGGLASGSGGTGLGLFISYSIARLHDGSLTCHSAENEGSTFTLTLPAFNQTKYDDIILTRPKIKQKHGWTIKNTSR